MNFNTLASENKTSPKYIERVIDIKGEKVKLLVHLGRELNLMSCDCYVNFR